MDGFVQDCGNSIANAEELPQPSLIPFRGTIKSIIYISK